jgi:hypothetical protein
MYVEPTGGVTKEKRWPRPLNSSREKKSKVQGSKIRTSQSESISREVNKSLVSFFSKKKYKLNIGKKEKKGKKTYKTNQKLLFSD